MYAQFARNCSASIAPHCIWRFLREVVAGGLRGFAWHSLRRLVLRLENSASSLGGGALYGSLSTIKAYIRGKVIERPHEFEDRPIDHDACCGLDRFEGALNCSDIDNTA